MAIEHDLQKTLHRGISWMAPMADGSIAYLESQTETLWFHWPDSKLADNPVTRQWIAELNSDDVRMRQNATVALLRNGRAIRPLVEQALAVKACTPEMRLRLESIASLLEQPSRGLRAVAESNQDFPGRELLPGREYGDLELVASRNGKALLRASECVNNETAESLPDEYMELSGMGRIRAITLSREPWSGEPRRSYPTFVDRSERIWLAGGCRVLPDGTVEEALPIGISAERIQGPDGQARLYLDHQRILNEQIGLPAPALPEQLVVAPASTFSSAGHRLWIVNRDRWPHRFSTVINGDKAVGIQTPWSDAGIMSPQYCFGSGVLLALEGKDDDSLPDCGYALYDGSTWDTDDDLSVLVERNAAFMSRHASTSLAGDERIRFGGTQDRFWFFHYIPRFWEDEESQDTLLLQVYDGRIWHDIAGALPWKISPLTQMLLVDGGRSMLLVENMQGQPVHIWIASLEQGQVKAKVLRELPARMWSLTLDAICLSDQTWISGLNGEGHISVLRNGTLSDFSEGSDHLLLGDSAGRGWYYDWHSKKVKVQDHGAWAEVSVDGTENTRVMGEDTDGRLWLVHGKAISQLSLKKEGGALSLQEIARYPWSQQRNHVERPVFDYSGGLWLLADTRGWIRIQLPQR